MLAQEPATSVMAWGWCERFGIWMQELSLDFESRRSCHALDAAAYRDGPLVLASASHHIGFLQRASAATVR